MSYKHITTHERCCIVNFKKLGWSLRAIASHLGRNVSSISRELKRNSINGEYTANKAQELYEIRRYSCGPYGKCANTNLISYIEEGLLKSWSPEQISGRLKNDFQDDCNMRIGFKTIYRLMYSGAIVRGEVRLLRRKGKSLKPTETRGKFNIGKSIKQRPKEVRKRTACGDWELDTVVSSRGKSKACLSTFVDRKSRFAIAMLMPDRKSLTFNEYCIAALGNFPSSFINTLTVDRGKEFAGYAYLEEELKTNVYFADPYCSWQRGTNENTNGLIREFFPKKFDFSTIVQEDVDVVMNLLNNRPRKCLNYKTPSEVFSEALNECCA